MMITGIAGNGSGGDDGKGGADGTGGRQGRERQAHGSLRRKCLRMRTCVLSSIWSAICHQSDLRHTWSLWKIFTIRKRLSELHINPGSSHSNPDNTLIIGSHWHIYREGYDRKSAFPATDINDDDFVENTLLFFEKFIIISKPRINYQLELLP